jgi:CRISPR/Cas system-associated endonuclease Cas1
MHLRCSGIEGAAGRAYFSRFGEMLKVGKESFSFEGRNKRGVCVG